MSEKNTGPDQKLEPSGPSKEALLQLLETLIVLTGSVPDAVASIRSKTTELLAPSGIAIDNNNETRLLELKKLVVRVAVDEVQGLAQELWMDLPEETDTPITLRGKKIHEKIAAINAAMAIVPEFKTGFQK